MAYRDSYPTHITTQTPPSGEEAYSPYYPYYPQQYYPYYNSSVYNVYGPPQTTATQQYTPQPIPNAATQSGAPSFAQHPSTTTNEDAVNLFINYLVPTITSEDLENIFLRFGEIESCKVMVNLDTGLSKGFGFVKYRSPEAAKQALQEMNGAEVQGKQIQVKIANTQGEIKRPRTSVSTQTSAGVSAAPYGGAIIAPMPGFGYPYPLPYPHIYPPPAPLGAAPLGTDPTNLYVNNLPIEANDEMLIKLFQPFGAIQSAKVIKDPVTNQSKGYGFVRMGTPREASAAIKGVSGLLLEGQTKPLTVQFKLNKSV
eukprot:TRINITY_DN8083_c0_g1_i1.p1 TRINITY_DN8083_c0_g1~~TRINITY_DN8083_c0_g1_i1.p1  ORF type:complete len:312 (+),score=65.33 TRINITY_DN8083_c0_g1_i1:92-1027(+)